MSTYFPSFVRMWRFTQIQPKHWLTPLTWPEWMASHTSTLYCAFWPLAAWCRLCIFVLAWTVISTTMALLHPFIHTSRHPLGGMKRILTEHTESGSYSKKICAQLPPHHSSVHVFPLLFKLILLSNLFVCSPAQVRRYYSTPPAGSGYRSRQHLPRFDGQT